jgi:hypothetical protein
LVLLSKTISGSDLSEPGEIDDVECRNMVWPSVKVLLPVTMLPEPVSFRFFSVVSHRSVSVGSSFEIKIDELLQVGSHNSAWELTKDISDTTVSE